MRLLITFLLCFAALGGHADSSVEKLSPELRSLLSKEMLALEQGMRSIIPAYASGDLDTVAAVAKQMKDSFILKQKITGEQKHELINTVPKAFLHLDKTFHEQAGMLAHVAEEGHTELVGFYIYKLNESCVGCHSQYASHRFPGFQPKADEKGHHH